jgi:hypothetical protein
MGIILGFLIVGAIFACLVTLAVAGALTLMSLYLVQNHHPAWRWPGAIVLTIYAGALLWSTGSLVGRATTCPRACVSYGRR